MRCAGINLCLPMCSCSTLSSPVKVEISSMSYATCPFVNIVIAYSRCIFCCVLCVVNRRHKDIVRCEAVVCCCMKGCLPVVVCACLLCLAVCVFLLQ